MRTRAVSSLSTVDAAYLAGLIDGEGTIALTRLHATANRQLHVSISSTEQALVQWTLDTMCFDLLETCHGTCWPPGHARLLATGSPRRSRPGYTRMNQAAMPRNIAASSA